MPGIRIAVTVAPARTTCRVCGHGLDPLLDLGPIHLSTFLAPGEPPTPQVPLDLVVCRRCELVQLRHTVSPDQMFRKYWYRSSVNEAMVAELTDLVEQAVQTVGGLQSHELVVDVGANDGTLLKQYPRLGDPVRAAFEPALNLFDQLRPHCEALFPDFFPGGHLGRGTIKILSSVACFYDVEDPHSFVHAVDQALTPDGLWVVQMQDLAQMVAATAYDNIVHEHLCYYSLKTFGQLLNGYDLAVVAAERRLINGGSLRILVRRRKYAKGLAPMTALKAERWLDRDALSRFVWRVEQSQDQLIGLLSHLQREGVPVDVYACSTKFNTLAQVCQLERFLRHGVERSPEKWGLVTVGTEIPIVSEEDWRADPAPVTLVGAWQFKAQILQREAAYLQQGGSFIVPLPQLEVVGGRV